MPLTPRTLALVGLMLLGSIFTGTARAQGLVNGGSVAGSIDFAGDQDSWTFSAAAGQGFQVRVTDLAVSALRPRVALYAPGGALVTTVSGSTVAALSLIAGSTGTYTIVIDDSSQGSDQTGPYAVHFTRAPGANELGSLPNGGSLASSIELGDLDSFTFSIVAGQSFQLRVADTGFGAFTPRIDIYDPIGAYFTGASGSTVAAISGAAPATGTYTVVLSDVSQGNDAAGDYEVHFVRTPGANEGGTLPNAGMLSGNISLGDLDSYTFEAVAGQNFKLRVADTAFGAFTPRIDIYDSIGAHILGASGSTVAVVNAVAPSTGTFTAVITDVSQGNDAAGPYDLHFIRLSEADEHGPLVNGGALAESIEIGDLDSYTFAITAGQSFELRVADLDLGGFTPRIDVFDPVGAYFMGASGSSVAVVGGVATSTGTYTVVLSDVSLGNDATGAYEVHFARVPGANEGGSLPNGGLVPGILSLGDLDSFTFDVNAGQSYQLRAVDTAIGGLSPRINVYDPVGAYVGGASGSTVAAVSAVATSTGTYTVVLSDVSLGSDAAGTYALHFVRVPGANEGGLLLDGVSKSETISLGDLDSYTFAATATEMAQIVVTDLAAGGLSPRVDLYGPIGEYITGASGSTQAVLSYTIVTGGVHTVVVSDVSLGNDAGGDYTIVLSGSGAAPGSTSNTILPPALPTDPILADNGGGQGFGPLVGDPSQPFNFALDCSGASQPSIYLMECRTGSLATPLPSPFGLLYLDGATILSASGLHAQGIVEWFPAPVGLALPNDAALIGLSYTAQGFVGGYGASGRLSNAIVQTIGG
ncbi:hypothetical protein [Engelhardtia mirabilis]|uniref:Peptidase C-terminal archaeal/bacterial domain-containing protein n=1 Tax=Engelhardtia mirabilis TaxID=2528011 RepID=A0A518BQU9_9BACT|nr:hypothetical protein Pla133_44390 [Planctomycetes bacterium Pla133]QDV03646.1 hypothetical protein Pla86_44370 [Planctomycetes bacterium Pla86]